MTAFDPTPTLGIDTPGAGGVLGQYAAQLRAELAWPRLAQLAAVTVEFALIVAAIRLLNIETRSFELVLTLALAGFPVHHFLPAAWRQGFFAALSVASVLIVFGWQQGGWLLAMGGGLILLCHLPLPMWARLALILATAAAMAAERKQALPWDSPVPSTIWPILGAMFMFRLIVYLYDLRHRAAPFGPARALGYFFMLPNACFPLFPVVDYKTLQRSAYNDDALRLYQTGAKWMLRGLVQLALYKVVYFLLVIEPIQAASGSDAARYMITTYLLYLKISALFHLIVGLLHMYGYGLAETHHMYLFASSFTDFWRRINIYWKDFIQKLVFNPVYFIARRLGATGALVVATLVAFVATWAFHSYQWFWIRGEFPIVWADLVFWFGLGLVVLVNVLWETRRGRRRSLTRVERSWREDVMLGLKIAGTFASICVLWTIWSTPKLDELGFIWGALLNSGPRDLAVLVGVPLAVGALGALFGGRARESFGAGRKADAPEAFWRQAAGVALVSCAFIVIALRPALLTPVSPALATLVESMDDGFALNAADSQRLQRGYYEDLGDVTRFNTELWSVYGGRPPDWENTAANRADAGAMREVFVPSISETFKGATLTINSQGLRDREYPLVAAPGTFRIALLGASHDMGAGVGDAETYENLVEDRLNRELGPRTGRRYEILNFSHGGYTATQKLAIVEQRLPAFRPDLVLYVANTREIDWVFKFEQLDHLARHRLLDQFPFVREALDRAGIRADATGLVARGDRSLFGPALDSEETVSARLAPFAEEGLRQALLAFRDATRRAGATPALVVTEMPSDSPDRPAVFDRLVAIGRSVGLPVLDLQGVYADVPDRSTLSIAPWDDHTNARGHRMLADRLYALLRDRRLVPLDDR